jgi:PilZ domain
MTEQRRSRRVLAIISLEIEWEGEPQLASTAVISVNGALILSRMNWPTGSELRIKNPDTGLQTLGCVVWCENHDLTGWYKLGVEFRNPSPEFWGELYDAEGEEAP